MRGLLVLVLPLFVSISLYGQLEFSQPQSWDEAEELFILRDYDPQNLDIEKNGHFQQWDVSHIDGPYLTPIQIGPSSTKPIEVSYDFYIENALGETYFLRESNDKLFLAAQQNIVLHNKLIPIFIKYDENLVEYELNISSESSGKSKAVGSGIIDFALLPPDLKQKWSSYQSNELKMSITIDRSISRGASGSLSFILDTDQAIKESITDLYYIELQFKQDGNWQAVPSSYYTNLQDKQTRIRFVTAGHFYPKATILLDSQGSPTLAEYHVSKHLNSYDVHRQSSGQNNLTVYPNPAYEYAKFQFENFEDGTYTIELLNILGQPIKSYTVDIAGNDAITLDMNVLPKGTYLYSVKDADGKTYATRRLVVLKP